jgi:hypothetical protein
MPTPVESPAPDDYVEVLVAQALDDLEEGRLDIEVLLRTLAQAAWEGGRRFEQGRSISISRVETTERRSQCGSPLYP